MIEALRRTTLRVQWATNAFGRHRDLLIARSKLVLNLHFYQPAVAEMFRMSHLFANGVAVVAEAGGEDEDLEAIVRRCAHSVALDKITEACLWLASDDVARAALATNGRAAFEDVDFAESVRLAVEATEKF